MSTTRHGGDRLSPPPIRRRVEQGFHARFGAAPRWLVRAPGRVNLLGAHVDYSEGWVLPGAIDRAVWLAARPAAGTISTIRALDLDREGTVDPASLAPPVAERPPASAATDWLDYPAGIAWALKAAEHETPPLEIAFGSDVPIGAGVSSSAAVEMAFLLAWQTAAGLELDGLTRAKMGQRVENQYLGVASGIMDQYASVHGRAGHLLLLDCRSLEHQLAPLPENLALLILDSGVRRRLAGSTYNDRPRECAEAVAILRRRLPEIKTLRDVGIGDFETHAADLPEVLRRRARHAIEECGRVLAGAEALRSGDPVAFGRLMRASHESSRDLYDVSIPELDLLAETAWSTRGCHGARLVGAGFGGCVTAVVESTETDAVAKTVATAFNARFGHRPASFVCRVEDGAGVIAQP